MILRKQFSNYLLHQKRYSDNTVTAYNKDLDQLYHFFISTYQFDIDNAEEVKKINMNHLRSWLANLTENQIEAKSIARKLSSVKTFFKFLKQQQFIETNCAAKLSAPKFSKKLPQFVQQNQMQLLFDAVEFTNDFAGKRDRLMIELLYLTGMRRAELISLTMTDVNFSSENLHVTGKGKKQRLIPLHPGILSYIQSYIKIREITFPELSHSFLFCTNAGKKLYPKFVYNTVKKYLSLITTLEKKSPHILRHTFATHMMNNGAELNTIKTLLGHASLASTQVYTHNSIEQLKEVYKKAHPKS